MVVCHVGFAGTAVSYAVLSKGSVCGLHKVIMLSFDTGSYAASVVCSLGRIMLSNEHDKHFKNLFHCVMSVLGQCV